MAFDGLLLISGSQVGPGALAAATPGADASDDVDCVAAPALSTYCKVGGTGAMYGVPGGSAVGAAPMQPSSRLAAHLSRSVTAAAAAAVAAAAAAPKRYGQRGYQPRFCIRGRNVNAKSSPALRRSMDDACLTLASSSHVGGRQFWPPLRTSVAVEDAAAISAAPLSLPAIPLDGSGFSHRLRSRSYYLTAADLTPAELETLAAAAAATPSDADGRVFAGLAWAEPDEQGDGGSQAASVVTAPATVTAAVARKRAKKKAAERISPAAQGAKTDVCDLRIEVKKNKVTVAGATSAVTASAQGAATALGAASAIATEKAAAGAVGRKSDSSDLKPPPFDSIDSYIGLGRRDWRRPQQLQQGAGSAALYHSAVSISCIKLSRHGDHDGDRSGVDMFMHTKPLRAT